MSYEYDAANELTAVNGQAYTYDANGNLTSNGVKTFVYDIENHLTQIKDSQGTVIASFTYDHEGKRTSMTTQSGTTYFHYNGDKVVYETDSNNNITAEYTWDGHGNPVTMTKSGVTYYYHINAHGDVTALTDANGNIAAQYSYDSWGNILSQTGAMASSNPYRYSGYRYDESTGLYYLMARYYDANVGRFITRDTFHGFEDEPLSLNQYAYTQNNPVMNVDPNGHLTLHLGLPNALAGYLIDYAIGGIVGGGISCIKKFIINKGKDEAIKIFTRTIVSKLLAWGLPKLASFIPFVVTIAMAYLNIGATIANLLDTRFDFHRNNGWVD